VVFSLIPFISITTGIDPKKSSIFIQSHVSAHAELTWLLNCITPLSWLERMIQFKEKSSKNTTSSVGVGLLNYPILMAADIILYQTNFVPVGEDQRQHLELARDIVRRFNELYQQKKQKPVFIEPKGLILSNGSARIMSLVDGTMKMSKSHPNDASRINLLDSFEVIQKKIKRCKTDSIPYLEYGNHDRPEANNLLNIYQQLTGLSSEEITTQVTGMNWSQFKSLLTEVVIDHLKPIQENYARIMLQEGKSQGEESRGGYLEQVLCEGRENAEILAMETLRKAKDAMGFYQLPGRQGTERR
jgi:tryptophanyl-tRNA synthetase